MPKPHRVMKQEDQQDAFALELDNLVAACDRATIRDDHGIATATFRAAWEVLALRGPFALAVTLAWRVGAQQVITSVPAGLFLPDGSSPLESRILFGQMPARCFEWFLGMLAAEAYFGNVKLPRNDDEDDEKGDKRKSGSKENHARDGKSLLKQNRQDR